MLIGGTLGLVMSSPSYTPVNQLSGTNTLDIDWTKAGSMNVVAWPVFWRFVSGTMRRNFVSNEEIPGIGIGIGGDCPLSAVMVSE